MLFMESMIFYFLIGAGVATAVFLTEADRRSWPRGFRVASALVFWPLFLPLILSRPVSVSEPAPPEERADEMAEAITQVEAELDAAMSSLDGWAEGVLAREADRIAELRTIWTTQAERIRELDRLLAQVPGSDLVPRGPCNGSTGLPHADAQDRRLQSEQARRANFERLRGVRRRSFDELLGTLAWVRELVSMIHLAKFTGAPASRAEELLAQISAAVEGVSAVTWQDSYAEPGPADAARSAFSPSRIEEGFPCDSSDVSVTFSRRT
ncbi:hypothetical protein BH23PLA1_BH23PLA1_06890 [soil metagenome]